MSSVALIPFPFSEEIDTILSGKKSEFSWTSLIF